MHASLVDVRNLAAGYGGRAVIEALSFAVSSGQLWAVIGPNGSGKSTLLKAITGELGLMRGDVLVNGRRIQDWKRQELAHFIGYLPQRININNFLTVREYLELGRYFKLGPFKPHTAEDRAVIDRVVELIDIFGLLDRRLLELSMGQLQRVRFARILVQEPQLLVVDEPLAHLDPHFEFQIMDIINSLLEKGMAVIGAFHDIELISGYATHAILLRGGEPLVGEAEMVMSREHIETAFGVEVRRCDGRIVLYPQSQPVNGGHRR